MSDTKYIMRLQDDSKVQHDLNNSLKNWDESRMFDDKQINAIESSNINSLKEPTSIPSPFARIALVTTAFSEVAKLGDRASAAYKKIVSDTLDIAEIFFTFNKWKNDIEIILLKYGTQNHGQGLREDSDLRRLEEVRLLMK